MNLLYTFKYIISLSLACIFFATALPITSNQAEMGLALTSIIPGIAAEHYKAQGKESKAAVMQLLTNLLSIGNKAYFFYNNYQTLNTVPVERDIVVQGLLMLRDTTKCLQAIRKLRKQHEKTTKPEEEFLDYGQHHISKIEAPNDALAEKSSLTTADITQVTLKLCKPLLRQPKHKIATLAAYQEHIKTCLSYLFKIGAIPTLKGLSSFLIAYTQHYELKNRSKVFTQRMQTHIPAVFAQSLIYLIEEYQASSDMRIKRLIMAMIAANIAWLCLELYNANNQQEMAVEIEKKDPCPMCYRTLSEMCEDQISEDDQKFITLSCGHSACAGCYKNHIEQYVAKYNQCPNSECTHCFQISEIQAIYGKEYDKVGKFERMHALKNISNNRSLCPNEKCKHTFERTPEPKNYTCPTCNDTYCQGCGLAHDIKVLCNQVPTIEKALSVEELEKITGEKAVQCPHCMIPIQRSDGCNHMKCYKDRGGCGREFCWLCTGKMPLIDGDAEIRFYAHYAGSLFGNNCKGKDENNSIIP